MYASDNYRENDASHLDEVSKPDSNHLSSLSCRGTHPQEGQAYEGGRGATISVSLFGVVLFGIRRDIIRIGFWFRFGRYSGGP